MLLLNPSLDFRIPTLRWVRAMSFATLPTAAMTPPQSSLSCSRAIPSRFTGGGTTQSPTPCAARGSWLAPNNSFKPTTTLVGALTARTAIPPQLVSRLGRMCTSAEVLREIRIICSCSVKLAARFSFVFEIAVGSVAVPRSIKYSHVISSSRRFKKVLRSGRSMAVDGWQSGFRQRRPLNDSAIVSDSSRNQNACSEK